jgi:hypothetical protein
MKIEFEPSYCDLLKTNKLNDMIDAVIVVMETGERRPDKLTDAMDLLIALKIAVAVKD